MIDQTLLPHVEGFFGRKKRMRAGILLHKEIVSS